jgi:hypothetical protein
MKLALVLVIPVVALLLLGRSVQTPTAEAKPTAIVTLNPTLCLTLTLSLDWNNDTVVDDADSAVALSACNTGLADEGTMGDLLRILEGDPAHPQPEDFASIDVEGGQIHETDGKMWFIAFVTNDDPIGFYADEGIFPISGTATLLCGPMASPGYDFEEEDCDDDGVRGDGMVAVILIPGADPDPATPQNEAVDRGSATFRVRQGGLEIEEAYSFVGEPWNIELAATEPTIQTGAVVCEMFDSLPTFVAVLNAPESTALNATVKDSDGTVLTAALVGYETDDPEKATPLLPLVPTLVSALGVGAPNVLCGQTDTGTVEITAAILKAVPDGGPTLEPGSRERHASVEVTVVGPPEDMVLSVSPASIVCDGVTGATVSAALTDADGNPAIDGNRVRFDVKTLATVNPIMAASVSGAATSTVTPLSDIVRGVTVKASLLLPDLDEDDEEILVPVVEKNILVECSAAAPSAPVAPPVAPSAPAISPPRTGDGGYLP